MSERSWSTYLYLLLLTRSPTLHSCCAIWMGVYTLLRISLSRFFLELSSLGRRLSSAISVLMLMLLFDYLVMNVFRSGLTSPIRFQILLPRLLSYQSTPFDEK
jgi:hypothetical protein